MRGLRASVMEVVVLGFMMRMRWEGIVERVCFLRQVAFLDFE